MVKRYYGKIYYQKKERISTGNIVNNTTVVITTNSIVNKQYPCIYFDHPAIIMRSVKIFSSFRTRYSGKNENMIPVLMYHSRFKT